MFCSYLDYYLDHILIMLRTSLELWLDETICVALSLIWIFYYNMNKADKLAYDRHLDALMIQNDVLSTAKLEGLEEGRVEGREEGIMVGRQEEKIATARNLKSLNIPIAVIVQATGLSIDEIDRL